MEIYLLKGVSLYQEWSFGLLGMENDQIPRICINREGAMLSLRDNHEDGSKGPQPKTNRVQCLMSQKDYSPKCSECGGDATDAQEDISSYVQMWKKKEGHAPSQRLL